MVILLTDFLLRMCTGTVSQNPIRTHMGDYAKNQDLIDFSILTHRQPNFISNTQKSLNTCMVDPQRQFAGLYLLVQPFNCHSFCEGC